MNKTSFSDFFKAKIVRKLGLLLVLGVIIGYLVSPQIIFRPNIYKEGDIIHQTITIKEDLLIPDKVSTSLKKERLLKELKPVYEFDRGIPESAAKRIGAAFKNTRSKFSQLNKEIGETEMKSGKLGREYFNSMLKHVEVQRKVIFYQTYKSILEERLKEFQGETKLSAKKLLKKRKVGYDLNGVAQTLRELEEKQKYHKLEEENLGNRFRQITKEKEALKSGTEERRKAAIDEFIKTLSVKFDENELKTLDFEFYAEDMENNLSALVAEILAQKIVSRKDAPAKAGEKIEIINLEVAKDADPEKQRVLYDLAELYDLEEAKSLVINIAKEFFPGDRTGKKKNFIIMLGQKLVTPTVSENRLKYEKRKKELISMTPVFFSVKKGEIIARTGDRLTSNQVELINGYYEMVSNIDEIPRILGIIFMVLLSLAVISFSFQINGKAERMGFKDLVLIMMSVLTTLIILKYGIVIGEIIEARFDIRVKIFNYILPVALSSMLVVILIGARAASLAGLLTAMFATIMTSGNHYYFFFAIVSGMAASLPVTKFESRYSILLHGMKISAVNLPAIIIINLIENNQIVDISLLIVGAALAGGLLIAIFTSILLPFFESIFDVTTNIKLLELSNMNHPALKDLILKAPGTYQHSVMVGNLAEAGASKIDANPLLARVASYYHDLGKMANSRYFVENQPAGGFNIHDSVDDPWKSAEIIISHLRKGEEMANKYRLGKAIKDIMLQHHGVGLVKFFYGRAEERAGSGPDRNVDKALFQYPGPKPQTLEAALVMMADIAEASTRSLDDPTPEAIGDIVEKLLRKALEDGQLDESGLTLKTFRMVVDAYVSMLATIHHHRIKYPENIKSA